MDERADPSKECDRPIDVAMATEPGFRKEPVKQLLLAVAHRFVQVRIRDGEKGIVILLARKGPFAPAMIAHRATRIAGNI